MDPIKDPRGGFTDHPDFTIVNSYGNGETWHPETGAKELLPFQVLYNED